MFTDSGLFANRLREPTRTQFLVQGQQCLAGRLQAEFYGHYQMEYKLKSSNPPTGTSVYIQFEHQNEGAGVTDPSGRIAHTVRGSAKCFIPRKLAILNVGTICTKLWHTKHVPSCAL